MTTTATMTAGRGRWRCPTCQRWVRTEMAMRCTRCARARARQAAATAAIEAPAPVDREMTWSEWFEGTGTPGTPCTHCGREGDCRCAE